VKSVFDGAASESTSTAVDDVLMYLHTAQYTDSST